MKRFFAVILAVSLIFCFPMISHAAPQLITDIGISVRENYTTETTIDFALRIETTVGLNLTDYGAQWFLDGVMVGSETCRIGEVTKATFTLTLNCLEPGTTYFVCGYAVQGGQTFLSDGFTATTKGGMPPPAPTSTPPAQAPTKVTVSAPTARPLVGTAYTLTPNFTPSGASSAITWKSSNAAIATINAQGVLTPIKEGSVTITATTANKKSGSVKLTVVDPYKPTGVTLSRTGTVTIDIDKPLELTAALVPDTARSAITWKSSNAKIATVSQSGMVTPIKEGTATITATASNNKRATMKVKVVDPYKPTGVTLNRTGTITVDIDQPFELTAALVPSTARSAITWKSSNVKVATVSPSGVVTPVKEGTANITVTASNNKKATIKVKVIDPYKPTGVTLNRTGVVILDMDKTLELAAALVPATARSAITWKSSNAQVATVSSSGVVTPVKEGTATITAITQNNNRKAAVKVKVVDPYKPTKIAIQTPATTVLAAGDAVQLSAVFTPAGTRSNLTWKSSNPAVASIDSTGKVTAHKLGAAMITVSTANKKTATIKIMVPWG